MEGPGFLYVDEGVHDDVHGYVADNLLAKADYENFPVASRLLPRSVRHHLLAVYAFARLADDIGDEHQGDRLAALDWLEAQLRAAVAGQPAHLVTTRLAKTIAATGLTEAPFLDLIAANRRDQTVHRQTTWEDLLDYCRLSANPIGAAVLAIADAATPERQAMADNICSGLQVIEHLQDVAEDAAAGRIYIPTEDLERFGVESGDLTAGQASPPLRAVVAFELARSRQLLASGVPLVRSLRGWPRLAVAGYVAGGLAAADAIEGAGYDVLRNPPVRPTRARTLRHALSPFALPGGAQVPGSRGLTRPGWRWHTGGGRVASRMPAAVGACDDGGRPAPEATGPDRRHTSDGYPAWAGSPPSLDQAYNACTTITRQQAKNFAYGIALLPSHKRRAMTVVYALARRIDDIVDDTADDSDPLRGHDIVDQPGDPRSRAHRLDELQSLVHRTAAQAAAADPNDAVLVALADVLPHYPLPLAAVDDLFEGCRADLAGTRYDTFDDLVTYCRQVAGSIGRLSLAIFGADDPDVTEPLADSLGVALQLTNILRDLVEDRDELGRVYLPTDDLARFGCAPDASGPPERLAALVTFEAERARTWYEVGQRLLPHLDRRSRACVAAMAGIYHRLLDRIERDPTAVLSRRVSLSGGQKLGVAGRSLLAART